MDNIPKSLIDAIKEQRTILFLGAGASLSAIHPDGNRIPQGDELRDIICDKFLNSALKNKPLNLVSGIAINEVGWIQFQDYIRDLFLSFEPANSHYLIPKFRWRSIATTNFDLIIEKAYIKSNKPLQNLVKTVKDGDKFDNRLHQVTNPVGLYKLHGCIDHHNDPDIPFILSNQQFSSYEINRTRFYDRLRDLAHENPVLFVGYSISDPHIQKMLFDLTDPKIPRPAYYLVSPNISDFECRYWNSHRVFSINLKFEDLLESLDRSIPTYQRSFSLRPNTGELLIRKRFRSSNATESTSLADYLETDVTYVHSGLVVPRQDPQQFYRGYDDGWGCILQNLDAPRSVTDSVLVDAILLTEENRRQVELFMLKGPGGNGKTVSLKRIAWESSVSYDQLTLFANNPAGIRIEPIAEIHRLTGDRVFLFIDHVALLRDEIKNLLNDAKRQSILLTLVGAERDNEWNIYCEQLEPYLNQEFPVRYLNKNEIRELLNLLEQHNSLGLLEYKSYEDRVQIFTEGAERQLLVALHEATLGLPFEDIVFDEYERIEPQSAQKIYLNICALHQFGAPVRAGLISRTTGIGFEQFKLEFIQPLEKIVSVIHDSHSNDIYYRSRHQQIAEILFYRALPDPDDKFELLANMLNVINTDYSSDRESFIRMIKGRGIARMFSSVELGRLFYDRLENVVLNDPFVFHQRAVFEMAHPNGSLLLAEQAATRAFELNPKSHSIKHTQAEIARKKANETDDPLRKQVLRKFTREKLNKHTFHLSEYDYHTRALLAIDEFKELTQSKNTLYDEQRKKVLLESVRDAENVIQGALQQFPESSELLAVEATFRELLDQSTEAQQILERAFNLNPRQSWLAIKLSRKYRASGKVTKADDVLEKCLQHNPSNKIIHLELGRVISETEHNSVAISHLRKGFIAGDNNFEAQFWYARELFLQECFEEADKMFSTLHDRAPGRFRRNATAIEKKDGMSREYKCTVYRMEEGYAFLSISQFPTKIFASRIYSDLVEWEKLYKGASAICYLAFNRRGASAISVRFC